MERIGNLFSLLRTKIFPFRVVEVWHDGGGLIGCGDTMILRGGNGVCTEEKFFVNERFARRYISNRDYLQIEEDKSKEGYIKVWNSKLDED